MRWILKNINGQDSDVHFHRAGEQHSKNIVTDTAGWVVFERLLDELQPKKVCIQKLKKI